MRASTRVNAPRAAQPPARSAGAAQVGWELDRHRLGIVARRRGGIGVAVTCAIGCAIAWGSNCWDLFAHASKGHMAGPTTRLTPPSGASAAAMTSGWCRRGRTTLRTASSPTRDPAPVHRRARQAAPCAPRLVDQAKRRCRGRRSRAAAPSIGEDVAEARRRHARTRRAPRSHGDTAQNLFFRWPLPGTNLRSRGAAVLLSRC